MGFSEQRSPGGLSRRSLSGPIGSALSRPHVEIASDASSIDSSPVRAMFASQDSLMSTVPEDVAQFECAPTSSKLVCSPEEEVIQRVREELLQHDVKSIAVLCRKFKKYSNAYHHDGARLNKAAFRSMLKRYCPGLTEQDIEVAFTTLDHDRDGHIKVRNFLKTIYGSMSQDREEMVLSVWRKFERLADGQLTYQNLVQYFDGKNHPDVLSGARSPHQVLKSFVREFDGGSDNGFVTQDEFIIYWEGQSAAIADDQAFAEILNRLWRIPDTCSKSQSLRPLSATSLRPADSERPRSAASLRAGKNEFDGNYRTSGSMSRSSSTGSFTGMTVKRRIVPNYAREDSGQKLGFGSSWQREAFQTSASDWHTPEDHKSRGPRGHAAGSPLNHLRAVIHQRGEDNIGFIGYGRKFKIASGGAETIGREGFLKMLRLHGMSLNEHELEELWQKFDREKRGKVDYQSFLVTLRGGMSDRRKQLVDVVFDHFDVNHDGSVDILEFRSNFNSSGQLGKNDYEVLRQFLITFGDLNEDGLLSRDEFHAYYDGVSAYIDDDREFELVLRNSWRVVSFDSPILNVRNQGGAKRVFRGEER